MAYRCPHCRKDINYELDNLISVAGLFVGLVALCVFTAGVGIIPSLYFFTRYGRHLMDRVPENCPHCGKKLN